MAWQAKSKILTGQLWPAGPGLDIVALEDLEKLETCVKVLLILYLSGRNNWDVKEEISFVIVLSYKEGWNEIL